MPAAEYDAFADIYSVWTDTAASTRANLAFYVDAYVGAAGPVVELGVGDGRIAVTAAARGRDIVGVDLSASMLELCRQRAAQAGVADRVRLIQADFRGFRLDEPAALIALPYHSIGHVLSVHEKRHVLDQVFRQLRPGGQFIFDDFLATPDLIAHMRRVQLRAEFQSGDGADTLLWVTSLVDEAAQTIRVVTWEDQLDEQGVLAERRYRRLSLSWLTPVQARGLLDASGFIIEACYGDFDRTPFADGTAHEQVWVSRKPA